MKYVLWNSFHLYTYLFAVDTSSSCSSSTKASAATDNIVLLQSS